MVPIITLILQKWKQVQKGWLIDLWEKELSSYSPLCTWRLVAAWHRVDDQWMAIGLSVTVCWFQYKVSSKGCLITIAAFPNTTCWKRGVLKLSFWNSHINQWDINILIPTYQHIFLYFLWNKVQNSSCSLILILNKGLDFSWFCSSEFWVFSLPPIPAASPPLCWKMHVQDHFL